VSVPWQPAARPRGLLLVGGEPAPVTAWVRRGLVACHIVPLPGWTALVPSEATSRASAPYDNALSALVARPVPGRMRPALGFLAVDGRAVVSVRSRGLRGGRRGGLRWVVSEPGSGVVRAPQLELARPSELAAAAGAPRAAGRAARVLAEPAGDAVAVLTALMDVLGLPGAHLLAGVPSGAGHVAAPTQQAVARFEARAAEEARHRAELENG
jgi:hypothetical protein